MAKAPPAPGTPPEPQSQPETAPPSAQPKYREMLEEAVRTGEVRITAHERLVATGDLSLWSQNGDQYYIRIPGVCGEDVLDQMVRLIKYAERYDLTNRRPDTAVHTSADHAPAPSSGGTKDTVYEHDDSSQEAKSGVHPLSRIAVVKSDKNPKQLIVKFYVDVPGFEWPMNTYQSPERVAALFDESLGWTAEHFSQPADYDNLTGLMAEWTKRKYYDVDRVFPAQ